MKYFMLFRETICTSNCCYVELLLCPQEGALIYHNIYCHPMYYFKSVLLAFTVFLCKSSFLGNKKYIIAI